MRIYSYGNTTPLSSGIVSAEEFTSLADEYEKVVTSKLDDSINVTLRKELPKVQESHSPLYLTYGAEYSNVVVTQKTQEGYVSVFDTEFDEMRECFINPSLKYINFTSYGYESIDAFLEEQVLEEDKQIWREFVENKRSDFG